MTGDVRDASWTTWQPTVSLTYELSEDARLFAEYSRGFRPGGFNQVGVVAVDGAGVAGVNDAFDAERLDTREAGIDAQYLGGKLSSTITVFEARARDAQYFHFLPANGSQNIANLRRAQYRGFEIEIGAHLMSNANSGLDITASYGYTDTEITEAVDARYVGHPVPLSSRSTGNVGVQYRRLLGYPLAMTNEGLHLLLKADYRRIGDTYWDSFGGSHRDPVDLLNIRVGIGGRSWSLVAWSRNATDTEYSAEFSPLPSGGLAFRAPSREWGLELSKSF
jgi:iron complex outermembrane receptor protein